jgi:DNA-binding CsgD family transcriptional regulator
MLLDMAAEVARARGRVLLQTVGVESESGMPYAGLHQLLRPLAPEAADLPTPQARALRTALGAEQGHVPDTFLVALATLTLLSETAATTPVVVTADDVQWLDVSTQEVLAFVARRVAADPVCLMGTVRRGHRGPFTAAGLAQVDVRPVGELAARQILRDHAAWLGDRETVQVLREALGNPLALVELPRALAAGAHEVRLPAALPLTERLERAFAGRTAGLSTAAREALLVAAVGSSPAVQETLRAASLLVGRPVGIEAVDEAAAAGLVQHDRAVMRFRHPLVRSGILSVEPRYRQQAAHAALADLLAEQPDRSTWHRAQSVVGPDDAIATALEDSARDAVRRGAVVRAIDALERAAQLTSSSTARGRRLLLAAEHAFGLGRVDAVERLLAAAAAEQLERQDVVRMQWLREIFDDGVPGDPVPVLRLCAVAEESGRAGEVDLALNLLVAASLRCWWSDTGPAARSRVAEVADAIGPGLGDARWTAALAIGEPVRRGRDVLARLADVDLEAEVDADQLRLLGLAAHAVGDEPRALDLLDRAELRLRRQGRLGLLPHVFAPQAIVLLELGQWQRQTAASGECRRLAEETGQPIWSASALVGEARSAALHGELERAFDLTAQVEQLAGNRRLNDLLSSGQLARGIAWIAAGRPAEAVDALGRLFDPADPCFHEREGWHGLTFLAEAAVHAERVPEARAVVAGLEQVATTTPSPLLHTHLRYARAVLADDDAAEGLFRDGLAVDLVRWPWAQARLDLAFGTWLRRRRRIAESRGHLRSALVILDQIGATTWADLARTELRAAGERPSGRPRLAATELSPQELQIAQLAAEGLSNKEIGQRLFLSPRTISSHLYRVFRKLEITSRAHLAERLHAVRGG